MPRSAASGARSSCAPRAGFLRPRRSRRAAMKHITCYLDFISPYAYLAFERLPQALEGLSYSVRYRPVLLGAMLKHHGQLGPARDPGQAHLDLSPGAVAGARARHPDGDAGHPSLQPAAAPAPGARDHARRRHQPPRGRDDLARRLARRRRGRSTPARLARAGRGPAALRDGNGDEARAQLRANTDAAIAAGAFGVPAFEVGRRAVLGPGRPAACCAPVAKATTGSTARPGEGRPSARGFPQGNPEFLAS